METIITALITGLLGGGAFAFVQFLIVRNDNRHAFISKKDLIPLEQKIGQLTDGYKVMLRNEIITACKKYIEAGEIGVMEASVLVDMETAYEALGGNGFTKELFKQAKKLPLIK